MRRMFSEKQIKELSQKSIASVDSGEVNYIVGIDESGNMVKKPLYEDIDIASSLTFGYGSLTQIQGQAGYCKIRKTSEDELYIVLNFSLTNNSENSQALQNYISLELLLPEDIASKIYDLNGDTVAEAVASSSGITAGDIYTDEGILTAGYYSRKACVVNNYPVANKCNFQIRDGGTMTSGKTWNFTFRIFLTL